MAFSIVGLQHYTTSIGSAIRNGSLVRMSQNQPATVRFKKLGSQFSFGCFSVANYVQHIQIPNVFSTADINYTEYLKRIRMLMSNVLQPDKL